MKIRNFLLTLMIITHPAYSQNEISTDRYYLKVELWDGTGYQGSPDISKFQVQTDYGPLTVPLSSTSTISFGLRVSEELLNNMKKELSKLTYAVSQGEIDSLIDKYGVHLLVAADEYLANGKNSGESFQMTKIIQAQLNRRFPLFYNSDMIDSDDFITGADFSGIEGKVELTTLNLHSTTLNLHSAYSPMKIPVRDINKITVEKRPIYTFNDVGNSNSRPFTLHANKNISSNISSEAWVDTKISLKQGQQFLITASGQITLKSYNGRTSTPNGVSKRDDSEKLDKMNKADVYKPSITNDQLTFGSLVYKIGEKGELKKAGEFFTGTADRSGNLYLSIYETLFNPENSGSYSVTIKVK